MRRRLICRGCAQSVYSRGRWWAAVSSWLVPYPRPVPDRPDIQRRIKTPCRSRPVCGTSAEPPRVPAVHRRSGEPSSTLSTEKNGHPRYSIVIVVVVVVIVLLFLLFSLLLLCRFLVFNLQTFNPSFVPTSWSDTTRREILSSVFVRACCLCVDDDVSSDWIRLRGSWPLRFFPHLEPVVYVMNVI